MEKEKNKMKNKTAKFCKAIVSKSGNYAILPILTEEGQYYDVIVPISDKATDKTPVAFLGDNGDMAFRVDLREKKSKEVKPVKKPKKVEAKPLDNVEDDLPF